MGNNITTSGTIVPFNVYTLDEAADLLKVNRKTVYQLQQEERLPKKKIGKGYKFLGEDLLRVMGSTTFSEKKDTD